MNTAYTVAVRVPVLTGFLDGRHWRSRTTCRLRVWCDFCCIWHTHGIECSRVGGMADRVAHCVSARSPYRITGIAIDISDIPFARVRDSVREANTHQQWIINDGRSTVAIERLREQQPCRFTDENGFESFGPRRS